MKIWMLLACVGCLLVNVTGFAASAPADDDEYEEVVVRRKKRKKSPAVAEQLQPAAAPVAVVPFLDTAALQRLVPELVFPDGPHCPPPDVI